MAQPTYKCALTLFGASQTRDHLSLAEGPLGGYHNRMGQPRYVKTKEQRVAAAEAKLAKAKADLKEADRRAETRRKIILGGFLQARAEDGDPGAQALLVAAKASLTREQDRAVFGLGPKPETAEEWADEALAAHDANIAAQKSGDKQTQRESHTRWRDAILNWERLKGRFWDTMEDADDRAKHGMGGIGELLPKTPR